MEMFLKFLGALVILFVVGIICATGCYYLFNHCTIYLGDQPVSIHCGYWSFVGIYFALRFLLVIASKTESKLNKSA